MSENFLLKLIPNGTWGKRIFLGVTFLSFVALPFLFGTETPFQDMKKLISQNASEQIEQIRDNPQALPKNFDPVATEGLFSLTQTDADRGSWTWSSAKRLSADIWEAQTDSKGYSSFYCGCDISRSGRTGGKVDLSTCGVTPRKNASRARRLEWEHVVPASIIARGHSCWTEGDSKCVDKSGKPFSGRSCCEISDPIYNMAATDPVNLVPAVGEINGDRSNYHYGEIPGEAREYGLCDMEIDHARKRAEPPSHRRGDIARIWAYMSRAYGIEVSQDQANLYRKWIAEDPISLEELRINKAITDAGHRSNPFVTSPQ
jgi:deoxyribonuclease-1